MCNKICFQADAWSLPLAVRTRVKVLFFPFSISQIIYLKIREAYWAQSIPFAPVFELLSCLSRLVVFASSTKKCFDFILGKTVLTKCLIAAWADIHLITNILPSALAKIVYEWGFVGCKFVSSMLEDLLWLRACLWNQNIKFCWILTFLHF